MCCRVILLDEDCCEGRCSLKGGGCCMKTLRSHGNWGHHLLSHVRLVIKTKCHYLSQLGVPHHRHRQIPSRTPTTTKDDGATIGTSRHSTEPSPCRGRRKDTDCGWWGGWARGWSFPQSTDVDGHDALYLPEYVLRKTRSQSTATF